MNVYTTSDTDKVLTPTAIDQIFSSMLLELYSNPESSHNGETFQLIVETIKEEASDSDEVLNTSNWDLVNINTEDCKQNKIIQGIAKIKWDHTLIKNFN